VDQVLYSAGKSLPPVKENRAVFMAGSETFAQTKLFPFPAGHDAWMRVFISDPVPLKTGFIRCAEEWRSLDLLSYSGWHFLPPVL